MSKELERLKIGIPKLKKLYENNAKKMSQNDILGFDLTFVYLDKVLQRLEAIENVDSNGALICLENISNMQLYENIAIKNCRCDDINTIKQSLIKVQEQEKENELLKEIIKSLFDRGCPLHQYIDKDFGLAIEVDDECSTMILGEYKGINLDKKLKEVLNNE